MDIMTQQSQSPVLVPSSQTPYDSQEETTRSTTNDEEPDDKVNATAAKNSDDNGSVNDSANESDDDSSTFEDIQADSSSSNSSSNSSSESDSSSDEENDEKNVTDTAGQLIAPLTQAPEPEANGAEATEATEANGAEATEATEANGAEATEATEANGAEATEATEANGAESTDIPSASSYLAKFDPKKDKLNKAVMHKVSGILYGISAKHGTPEWYHVVSYLKMNEDVYHFFATEKLLNYMETQKKRKATTALTRKEKKMQKRMKNLQAKEEAKRLRLQQKKKEKEKKMQTRCTHPHCFNAKMKGDETQFCPCHYYVQISDSIKGLPEDKIKECINQFKSGDIEQSVYEKTMYSLMNLKPKTVKPYDELLLKFAKNLTNCGVKLFIEKTKLNETSYDKYMKVIGNPSDICTMLTNKKEELLAYEKNKKKKAKATSPKTVQKPKYDWSL